MPAPEKPRAGDSGGRTELRRCVPALTRLREPRERFEPAAPPRGWRYGEDVAGNNKPGWLASATGPLSVVAERPAIEFELVLGAQRRLLIGRLASYEPSMGRVGVALLPARSNASAAPAWSVEVDSYWAQPISVVQHAVFELPSSVPPGKYRLRLELLTSRWRSGPRRVRTPTMAVAAATHGTARSRFKLLSISSC